MPSLLHAFYAYAVPRLRGAGEMGDVEVERARIRARHAGPEFAFRRLPTRLVPGFERRFEVGQRRVPFPVHTIRPRGERPRTTVYYLHGGGYVAPVDAVHVRYATRLARVLDAEVVLPSYPLAPEHTWRDSHDVLADDLAEHTARQDRVVLVGDSAGGGLALALLQTLRDRGAALPSHVVLHSPWVDLTTSTPETAEFSARDPWLKLSKLEAYAGWWAGSPEDLGRPEVSPALGDLGGLPPALMFCGTRDTLAPGCRLLERRAAEADWDLTYIEVADLIHVYPLLPFVPEAKDAWARTIEFLG